jgi:hypothetical protein
LTGFNWPYSIAIRQSDRVAFVADTQNHRVLSYNVATNKVIASYGVKGGGTGRLAFPSGIAVDPVSGHVWVADAGNDRVVELSDTAGSGMTQVRALNAGFSLAGPQGVAVDGAGNVAVADTDNDRIVVMDSSGAVAATQDGFARPANLAVGPDGMLYVSDTYNDRVRVFSMGTPVPDTTAPDGTITTPTAGQSVPRGVTTFSGTAADDRALAAARVSIKNVATGLWQRPDGTWGKFAWLDATLANPGQTSSAWSYQWDSKNAGDYAVQLRIDDAAGNIDPSKPTVRFSVTSGGTDTTPPDATVTTPTPNQVFPSPSVSFRGSATDNVGIASVKVAVKKAGTTLWWTGSGWGTYTALPATLTAVGAASTGWSLTWAAPESGSFNLSVIATDTAGNVDPTKPFVAFSVA